ncbi:GNAT family N-acetyltransferase [Kitasatospora sp. NPDC004531]
MPDLSVRLAGPADRPTVERLWLLFSHDMSEFNGHLPNADGTFREERLRSAFGDPDWAPYLLTADADRPVGFVFVRGLNGPARVVNSFFVVRAARRNGTGLRAVEEVVGRHPGAWQIPFQESNAAGARFWRKAAGRIAGEAWTEERREVPGRPEAEPDVWISFRTPAAH